MTRAAWLLLLLLLLLLSPCAAHCDQIASERGSRFVMRQRSCQSPPSRADSNTILTRT